jgi:hypothetical protein
MKQWEYKTVSISHHEMENKLKELVLEGWEHVSVSRVGPVSTGLYFFLRRQFE